MLVTGLASGLETSEIASVGRPWLEALVFAILSGVALRSVWTPPEVWRAGVEFSAKTLLEIAVVPIGASVRVGAHLSVGPALIAGIAGVVVMAIASSFGAAVRLACPNAWPYSAARSSRFP